MDLDPLSAFFLISVVIFFTLFLVIPIFSVISAAFIVDGQFSFDFFVSVFKNPIFFELDIGSFLFLSGFSFSLFFASKLVNTLKNYGTDLKQLLRLIVFIVVIMGFFFLFSVALEVIPAFFIGIALSLLFVGISFLINKKLNVDIDDYFLTEGVRQTLTFILAIPILAFVIWILISIISQFAELYDVLDSWFNVNFAIIIAIIIGLLYAFLYGRRFSSDLKSSAFLKPFLWLATSCIFVLGSFLFSNVNIIASGWRVNFYEKVPDIAYGSIIKIGGMEASVLVNTLFVAISTTLLSAGIGIFFAFIIARYEFFGKSLLRVIILIPLVIPPFVGAIGIRRMLAHPQGYSFFNRLLYDAIPFLNYPIILKGLTAVIIVQSVHFYTLVYLNSLSAFQNIDPSLEESAENLGAGGRKIFSSITFPLAVPGIAAGSILTFILSVEDLGTPLIFSGDTEIENLLTTKVFRMWLNASGTLQGDGLALAVILFVIAMAGFTLIRRYVGIREYAMVSKGGTFNPRTRKIPIWGTLLIWLLVFLLMSFALMPHIGTFLLAVSNNFTWTPSDATHLFPTALSFQLLSPDIGDLIRVVSIPLLLLIVWFLLYLLYRYLNRNTTLFDTEKNPVSAYGLLTIGILAPIVLFMNLPNSIGLIPIKIGIGQIITDIIGQIGVTLGIEALEYIGVVGGFSSVIQRTTVYSLIAVLLIIIFGIAAAYVLARKNFPGKFWFDTMVTSPIAIPGIIVGFGLYTFYIPLIANLFGASSTVDEILPGFFMVHFLLITSFTVRRFPFTIRAAYAGLQQTHETFEEASKNLGASNIRTLLKITIPLIGISVIAGAMMSFVYALGEVSTSLILLSNEETATIPWMINEKNRDPLPQAGVLGMNQAAALGMLLVLLQVLIMTIANNILKRRGSALTGI